MHEPSKTSFCFLPQAGANKGAFFERTKNILKNRSHLLGRREVSASRGWWMGVGAQLRPKEYIPEDLIDVAGRGFMPQAVGDDQSVAGAVTGL